MKKGQTTPLLLRNKISAAIIVGTVVAIALMTTTAGIFSHIDPRRLPVAGCLNLAYPLLLIVDIIITILVAFLSRKLMCIGLLAVVLTSSSALDYSPLNFFSKGYQPDKTDSTFTMMSFNVATFWPYDEVFLENGENPLLEYILEQDPDIAVLQEIERLDESKIWHISKSQSERLHKQYPYTDGPHDPKKCPLAVLSKFPLKNIENKMYSRYGEAQIVEVVLPEGQEMTIVNVHLQSLGLTKDDKELYTDVLKANLDQYELASLKGNIYDKLAFAFEQRAIQADSIRHIILNDNRIKENLIVTGDFNDTQNCWALRHICDGTNLKSAYRSVGFGPLITYYANHFYFRIDHTLYRGDLKPLAYRCDQSFKKSDHYPTFTTFSFTDK